MKFVRAMAAFAVIGALAIPASAQAGTSSSSQRLSIAFFGTGAPAFGGSNPAFGGNGNAIGKPAILPVRRGRVHPLPGLPVRRGRPIACSPAAT